MRSDRVHPQCRTGSDDGSKSSTEGFDHGSGQCSRGGDRAVEASPWFDPVNNSEDISEGCVDGFCLIPGIPKESPVDMVNQPPHYAGFGKKIETIDKIEDAVQFAPDAVLGGLQWQVMKYLDRMWQKGDPLENASKASWYLNRLIDKLS